MKIEQEIAKEFADVSGRRSFLRRASLGAAFAAFAPAAALMLNPREAHAAYAGETVDAEVLNFALNLEYLEAQYYIYATTGAGIEAQGVDVGGVDGPAGSVTIKSNPKVTFSNPVIAEYAAEIAHDELNHVKFLRSALSAAGGLQVAQPEIDLLNSFNGLASAAGIASSFDPFADDISFLLGAFIFEDVGVTAYHGGAPLITNKTYLSAAAGILAVEAYHASEVRTVLYAESMVAGNSSIIETVQKISNLRDAVGSPGVQKDMGIVKDGKANIVPTDSNSLAFSRTTTQVLRIVYASPTKTPGGFFPKGMNGAIK